VPGDAGGSGVSACCGAPARPGPGIMMVRCLCPHAPTLRWPPPASAEQTRPRRAVQGDSFTVLLRSSLASIRLGRWAYGLIAPATVVCRDVSLSRPAATRRTH